MNNRRLKARPLANARPYDKMLASAENWSPKALASLAVRGMTILSS
jgi:hypothetical protein